MNRRMPWVVGAALGVVALLAVAGCGTDPSTRFARLPDGAFNEGNGRIVLNWEPVQNPEFGGYFVYIGKRKHGKKIKVNETPAPKTTLNIEGLSIGEKYFFQIRVASNTVPVVEGPPSTEFAVVAEPTK